MLLVVVLTNSMSESKRGKCLGVRKKKLPEGLSGSEKKRRTGEILRSSIIASCFIRPLTHLVQITENMKGARSLKYCCHMWQ